jgi:FtsZ-binding cell division protein ZapB
VDGRERRLRKDECSLSESLWVQIVGAVVAAFIASVFTLGALWANRKMGLNPAKDSLIGTLKDTVAELRIKVRELDNRILALERENDALLRENTTLRRENAELLRENNAFRRRLEGSIE